MELTEERIKDIAAIQQRMTAKISSHQKEIRMLEMNLEILDEILKESSFTKASNLLGKNSANDAMTAANDPTHDTANRTQGAEETIQGSDGQSSSVPPAQVQEHSGAADVREGVVRPIRRGGGNSGETIANAHIAKNLISITMAGNAAALREDIPPFKSFFVGKILEGMRRKDQEDAESGKIPKEAVISYEVETDDTDNIKRIFIKNYGDERRATELVSTVGWSFARMLEKVGG